VQNPFLLTGILVLFILVGLSTHYPFVKRLKTILPVAVLIILFQLIFNRTQTLDSRLLLGYLAATRLVAISLSVLLFLTITSITELVSVLSFLPKSILLIIMMTWYFIPGVLRESEKISAVQKSRGMNMHNLRIIQNLASLLIPLLHRVFQRAETLSLTLLARGYEE
jgi:energy-coupling factor transporter transmembrane protein EcfT